MRKITFAFLFLSSYCYADIEGKVVAVSDGDTITVLDKSKQQNKIRLKEATDESKKSFNKMEYHSFSDTSIQTILDEADNKYRIQDNPLYRLKLVNSKYSTPEQTTDNNNNFYIDLSDVQWVIIKKNKLTVPNIKIYIPGHYKRSKKSHYEYLAECNFDDPNKQSDFSFRADRPETMYTFASTDAAKKSGVLINDNMSTEYYLPQYMIYLCLMATSQEIKANLYEVKKKAMSIRFSELNKKASTSRKEE